jgi:anti-anti-sigma factor
MATSLSRGEASDPRVRALLALDRAHLSDGRARKRFEEARRSQLRTIELAWQSRHRCLDRLGTIVAMAQDPDGLLEIEVRWQPNGPVLARATGEIDVSSVAALEAAVVPVLEAGRSVLVDLTGVTFMDATGIGVLGRARKLAANEGVAFTVCGPTGLVRRVLELTGFDELVADCPNADDD